MYDFSLQKSRESDSLLQGGVDDGHDLYGSVNHNANKDNSSAPSVYWYRWYICIVFAMLGMMQGGVWNTWSPINQSAECALGFTESDIDLLANWGGISFLVCMPVFMWLLHRKGLRLPIMITAFLSTFGTGLRCLPLPVNMLRIFIHMGQILNGAAGCIVMAAPTLVSNVWFPQDERVTATSITILFNYIGTGLAFIVGPMVVRQPRGNGTLTSTIRQDWPEWPEVIPCNSSHERKIIRKEIATLMYLEFGLCVLVFLSILIFFPNKPPSPPSASASVERADFKEGLKSLAHKKTFLIVTFTFALTVGSFGGWMGVVSVMVAPFGISQNEAGKIGLVMTLAGCAMGIIIGWFADRFKGRMKIMITSLFILCFFAYLYYVTMSQGWIKNPFFEFSHVGLWIVCTVIGIGMNAVFPLGMELSADAAYPVSEAISSSVFVWFYNLLMFVLLLVLQFTNPMFANYLMLAFIGISIPLLLCFAKEPNNRMQLDAQKPVNDMTSDLHTKLYQDPNINTDTASYEPGPSFDFDTSIKC